MGKKIYNLFIKTIKSIDQNSYDLFLVGLLILNILPIIAPLLMSIGLEDWAKVIYNFYAFLCHQISWRSLHFHDYQYAWCVRDTFIWLNVLWVGIIIRKYQLPKFEYRWIILFLLPIVLDGGIQTIATVVGLIQDNKVFYVSNNFFRMITGTLFGIGLGIFLLPTLLNHHLISTRKELKLSKLKIITVLIFVNLVFYLILLTAWRISSTKVLPKGFFDEQIKAPANVETWLERCENCH